MNENNKQNHILSNMAGAVGAKRGVKVGDLFERLLHSYSKRLKAIKAAGGGATDY